MHIRRGIIAGVCWGVLGFVGAAAGNAAFTFDYSHRLQYDIEWWWSHYAFPGVVVIPMLLFFTGVVTYMPPRHVRFAKNLVILAITTFPLAAILGTLGMAYPRVKASDPPLMSISEVLMFFLPLTAVSSIMIAIRSSSLPEEKPSASFPSTPITTEQTDEREPD